MRPLSPVKVFLRPYRGGSIQREFTVKIPAGLAKGELIPHYYATGHVSLDKKIAA